MIFKDFLKENKVSYYKLTQLAGSDPTTDSNRIKQRATGEATVTPEEFKKYCDGLSQYLHLEVKPEGFDFTVEKVRLK